MWTGWIEETKKYRLPSIQFSVATCEEIKQEQDGTVRFNLIVRPERWPQVKDLPSSAIEFSKRRTLTEVFYEQEMALERAHVGARTRPADLPRSIWATDSSDGRRWKSFVKTCVPFSRSVGRTGITTPNLKRRGSKGAKKSFILTAKPLPNLSPKGISLQS